MCRVPVQAVSRYFQVATCFVWRYLQPRFNPQYSFRLDAHGEKHQRARRHRDHSNEWDWCRVHVFLGRRLDRVKKGIKHSEL